MATEYVIDGSRITSLETFYDEISRVLIPGRQWGRNLDAFNDILRGGFGTPEDGFTLKWSHSEASRDVLSHLHTVRGEPVFDCLVDIILGHGPGGSQPGNVVLVLS